MQRSEFAPFVGKSLSQSEISQLAEVDGMIALIGKNTEGEVSGALAYMLDLLPIHQVDEFSWRLSKKEEFLDHCDRDEIFGSGGDAFKPGEEIFCLDGEITFEELSLDKAEEEDLEGFWLKVGDRVEHIKDPGLPGTVITIDANLIPSGITTCIVRWDDGDPEGDITWTNKLTLVQ